MPTKMFQPVGYRWEGGVLGYWSEHGDLAVGYKWEGGSWDTGANMEIELSGIGGGRGVMGY